MLTKFLDDNKPNWSHLKIEIALFQTQFHLICQMLGKVSGVETERTVSFRKRKRIFLCGVHVFHKAGP